MSDTAYVIEKDGKIGISFDDLKSVIWCDNEAGAELLVNLIADSSKITIPDENNTEGFIKGIGSIQG